MLSHRLSSVPEYSVWTNIKTRCFNPNNAAFKNYGGRGITMAPEWLDFAKFYADMGPRPTAGHTIERRENDAGYSKDNCYWAPREQQSRNRRGNIRLTHDGQTMTLLEWARHLGLPYQRLYRRHQSGWTPEQILSEPYHGHRYWRN